MELVSCDDDDDYDVFQDAEELSYISYILSIFYKFGVDNEYAILLNYDY